MAKKVKFPLDMGNEVYVRTLEELKENYNSEKVTEYFLDGRLLTWLNDRYFDDEAEQVQELMEQEDKNNIAAKLGKIFGIEIQEDVDVENLEIRREKLDKLRLITADDEILDNVDSVAFSQDELGDLLDEEKKVIYLCGEKFRIPSGVKNVRYIGVNKPVIFISGKGEIDLEANGIVFENCEFSDDTAARFSSSYKYNQIASKISKANINGIDEEHKGVLAVHEAFGYNQDMTKLKAVDWNVINYNLIDTFDSMRGNVKKKEVSVINLSPPAGDCCYNFIFDKGKLDPNDIIKIFSEQYNAVVDYLENRPTVSDRFNKDTINKIIGSGAVYKINQQDLGTDLAIVGGKALNGMRIVGNAAFGFASAASMGPLDRILGIEPDNSIFGDKKIKAPWVMDNGGIKYCTEKIGEAFPFNAQKWYITIKISAERYSEFIDKFIVPLVYFSGAKECELVNRIKRIKGRKRDLDMSDALEMQKRIESGELSKDDFEFEDVLEPGWVATAKTKSLKKYEEYKMQPLLLVNMKALFDCVVLKIIDKDSKGTEKSIIGTCAGFFSVEFE